MIDRWLTQNDDTHAAASMGLYRILYSATYLAMIVLLIHTDISHTPVWKPIRILKLTRLMSEPPPAWLVQLTVIALVVSLIGLGLGYHTHLSTLCVLIFGGLLSTFRYSSTIWAHDRLFMEVYIPAVMVFSTWGETYSLDARAGRQWDFPPDHWRHIWPRRAVLVLLVIIFASSAFVKLMEGNFLQPDNMRNFLLLHEFWMPLYGFPVLPIPFGSMLADIPMLPRVMAVGAIVFEAGWILALINRRLTSLWLLGGVGFHMFNALAMNIYFPAFLLSYAIFVQWHRYPRLVFLYIGSLVMLIAAIYGVAPLVDREIIARMVVFALLATLTSFGLIFTLLLTRVPQLGEIKQLDLSGTT